MPTLHTATTGELTPALARRLRGLLDRAFDGNYSDDDWQHATGGVHVWLAKGDELISHGSVVPRTIECCGHRLRAGYVEAIATIATQRRKGYATQIMVRLNQLILEGDELGVLSTGTKAFYETVGWTPWRGQTFVDGPAGRQRTPDDDDSLMVLRTASSPPLNLDGDIVCEWRSGEVW